MRRKRVLFVCIGNSCRSQMAEGFARRYGEDVLDACSAGVAPAQIVMPLTRKVMQARNIDLGDAFPKAITDMPLGRMDLIINMSGQRLTLPPGSRTEEWVVRDPIGLSESAYEEVAADIEARVMRLILAVRTEKPPEEEGAATRLRREFDRRGPRQSKIGSR